MGALDIIVTPLTVKSEPIQPMTPRYMICMQVPIKGAKASPKVCTKSSEASIEKLFVRNPYALTNVKISRITPIIRTEIPVRAILSLKFFNIFEYRLVLNSQEYIKSSYTRNQTRTQYQKNEDQTTSKEAVGIRSVSRVSDISFAYCCQHSSGCL